MEKEDFMMSVETYKIEGRNSQEILFSRAYVNEKKELTFLNCSAFTQFPELEFILSETEQSIELRQPNQRKKVFVRLDDNKRFFQNAIQKKKEIMDLLREYTLSLQTGKEKVIVKEIGFKSYPYLFTTASIENFGCHSSKFITGFLYFSNLKLKEMNVDWQFDNYDAMQERLGNFFKSVGMKSFQIEEIEGEKVYTMPFDAFIKLLK